MMIEPFLKWPGGKRWLISKYANLLPACYTTYAEPFLGSGAIFFRVAPSRSVLADSNEELINAYLNIKNNWKDVELALDEYQVKHSVDFYYYVRDTFPENKLDRAIRFIYLNRTCFNGMYRVNRAGIFNVPIGTKTSVAFPKGYLRMISERLSGSDLKVADFEKTLNRLKAGAFAFVDPPYTVMHNNNGFIKYNANLFSWTDQVRLAAAVRRAVGRGVSVLLSNADHSDVRDLYKDFGEHIKVNRASVLSAIIEGRRSTTELIVRSYPVPQRV